MVRTQIYLTDAERRALQALSHRTGKSQSELIREAVDQMLARSGPDRKLLLREARGLWKDRDDLPDFERIRGEMDRPLSGDAE